MFLNTARKNTATLWLAGAALLFAAQPQAWAAQSASTVPLGTPTIKLGSAPYADELTITMLATEILQKIGYKVQVQQSDVGIWFGGLASGSLDVGLNAWLPVTHGQYWKRYKNKLEDLGIIYKPTKLGWAVPDYIPKSKLDSIPQLKNKEVKEKLDGIITGISAGAGETKLSKDAVKQYGLDDYGYTLQTSSGPAMAAALARAIKGHRWIVVTAWTPHWMWARWKLRYLKDPKGILGGDGTVHAVARSGFRDSFPRAAAFIEHFKLPVSDVEGIMNDAEKLGGKTPYAVAAKNYIKSHPKQVKEWLSAVHASK